MKQLSDQFPRFGYRRILVLMEQLGHAMGPDKALRLWQKAGLQVPRKRPRKRVAHSRPRPQLPSGANEVWAYDFVHDACANGQQLKCLTIIDEYTSVGDRPNESTGCSANGATACSPNGAIR